MGNVNSIGLCFLNGTAVASALPLACVYSPDTWRTATPDLCTCKRARKFLPRSLGMLGVLNVCFLFLKQPFAHFPLHACSENANIFFSFTPYLSAGGFSERKFAFNRFSKIYRRDFSGHKLIFIFKKKNNAKFFCKNLKLPEVFSGHEFDLFWGSNAKGDTSYVR